MDTIVAVLVLVSTIAFFTGLKSPKKVVFWAPEEQRTRGKSSLVWGVLLFLSLMVAGKLGEREKRNAAETEAPAPIQPTPVAAIEPPPPAPVAVSAPTAPVAVSAPVVPQTPPAPSMPEKQVEFNTIMNDSMSEWENASNEIQQKRVYSERAKALKQLLPGRKFSNWLGTIDEIKTNSDGDAELIINLLDSKAQISTVYDVGNFSAANTAIRSGSALYEAVGELSSGDKVVVSGTFPTDPAGEAYLRPPEMDNREDSIKEPRFWAKFSSVKHLSQ